MPEQRITSYTRVQTQAVTEYIDQPAVMQRLLRH